MAMRAMSLFFCPELIEGPPEQVSLVSFLAEWLGK